MSVMSQLDLQLREHRCGNCGSTQNPADTVVIDPTPRLLCDYCVATFDWSDWYFDPVWNVYSRT